jgi:hypothetical protein
MVLYVRIGDLIRDFGHAYSAERISRRRIVWAVNLRADISSGMSSILTWTADCRLMMFSRFVSAWLLLIGSLKGFVPFNQNQIVNLFAEHSCVAFHSRLFRKQTFGI